jgi:cystathionine beta-lyase
VIFKDTAALRARDWRRRGYTYGLHGTPTTFTLEERIATLEGGLQTAGAQRPGGHGAGDLALLSAGDEVLLPANVYGPSRENWRATSSRAWGITHRLYDPMERRRAGLNPCPGASDQAGLARSAGFGDDGVPGPAWAGAGRPARGVLTALDNTWGAGIAFNAFDAFEVGVDIAMQALTKYPSGGGDVLMGSVTTRDEALHQRLKLRTCGMGLGVAANDAELVLRSLPTIGCAMRRRIARRARWPSWLATPARGGPGAASGAARLARA